MDIKSKFDSTSSMELGRYSLLVPQASNGYMRRNIDSNSYMDLRSYFLMDIKRNIDSKSYMDLRSYFLLFPATSFYFFRLLMDIQSNFDSTSSMELGRYTILVPQASNAYMRRNIDSNY